MCYRQLNRNVLKLSTNIGYVLSIDRKKFATPLKCPPSWFLCALLQFFFFVIVKNIVFMAKRVRYKNMGKEIFNKYDPISFYAS